ncbi:MAG TPA: anthranilate synthase component I family protein [Polyangiaceae bacterium]
MLLSAPVDAPADPFLLARALEGRSSLVLARSEAGRVTYLACDPLEESHALDPEPDRPLAPREHGEVPRWFGLLPYEARRSLERGATSDARPSPQLVHPVWRRYGALLKITHRVELLSTDARAMLELRQALHFGLRRLGGEAQPVRVSLLGKAEPGALHTERIRRALDLIQRGDIYQVNLARRFELAVEGSAVALLDALAPGVLPSQAAAFDWPELRVAAASPELFLATEASGRASTTPIKGTRPRSPDAALDQALARALDDDPKERAELAMVIDVERNDLGRLATPGSVRLARPPFVESHSSVHHRAATVEASLRTGVTRGELLEAMLPSGSVTGAPKIRAMEVIAELEPVRRGLYTGAFGLLREDGSLELSMAIRTLSVKDGIGHFYVGGGIVADSEPERELEETLWKARGLIALAGGSTENWA